MNAILKINNDYSYLLTSNKDLKNKIKEKLRWRKKDYSRTSAYQQGKWDGYVNFFDDDTGKFLTGLLLEVRLLLNHYGIEFETVDSREDLPLSHKVIDSDFLKPWNNKFTLFDYQVDLVNKALQYGRGIIQSPTASGKTAMMIAIMKAINPGLPMLFLANRKNLISQNYQEIKDWGFKNVGRFSSDYHEPDLITCTTVQSAHHLDKYLKICKVVIADEVHMLNNKTSIRIFKKLSNAVVRVAVSATPFKHGGTDYVQKYTAKGYFGPVFKTSITESGVLTTNYLQNRGNLSDSECHIYYIDEPSIPYDIFVDAVTNGISNNVYFHKVVQRLAMKLKGRTLILVERIAHGDTLSGMIPGALWVQGKDTEDTRKYVINQLQKSNENVVAIAMRQIFDTGINFFLHNIVDCTCIGNEHGTIQAMGRGLRTASDKDKMYYYGFIHRTNPYLEKQSKVKVRTLKKEKHNVIIHEEFDF